MGLDMFLYKVQKVRKEEAALLEGLDKETIEDRGYTVFAPVYPDDLSPIMFIMPYLRRIKIRRSMQDGGKASAAIELSIMDNDSVKTDASSSSTKSVSTDLDERCAETDFFRQAYVCKMNRITHWWKNFELQRDLYKACYAWILNCGYYPLNDEMEEILLSYGTELPTTDADEIVTYHEWY